MQMNTVTYESRRPTERYEAAIISQQTVSNGITTSTTTIISTPKRSGVLHGMAQSSKGVAPAADNEKKLTKQSNPRRRLRVEECNGRAEEDSATGKDNNDIPQKNQKSSNATKKVAAMEDVEGGGEAQESRTKVLREEFMTQVLKEYNTRPTVQLKLLNDRLSGHFIVFGGCLLDGNMALTKATLLRYMRKCPSKINEHDAEGRTALSLALMEQRQDIADLIISVDDADVNAPDTITGLSPLHNAVLQDLGSSAQKLAFRGANVNAADKVGMTPLMLGCRMGHESMVNMLVDVFGAEVDQADKAGWTCLCYAAYHNEFNIVQFLLMRGAEVDHKDKRGMTAFDWAKHMGLEETCAIFSRFASKLVP